MESLNDMGLADQTCHLAPDRLRSEQITIIARWTSVLALCSVSSGVLVLRTFWSTASHAYVASFFFCLCILHGLAVGSGIMWLRRTSRKASSFMLRSRIVVTAVVALVWASVPIMLMPDATADQRQLLIYIGSGLMSSSILLAPMMPAALAFLFITTAGVLLPMPLIDQSITLEHTWMILLYMFATWGVVHNQAHDFSSVWSRGLMVHSSRVNGRMRYGSGSARQRHDDSGSPSSDPA
jgi:hypothetical protein